VQYLKAVALGRGGDKEIWNLSSTLTGLSQQSLNLKCPLHMLGASRPAAANGSMTARTWGLPSRLRTLMSTT
jgi:hypothetical protein